MSESKSVILNGQVLHGNDRLGRWKVTQLEGWSDSPAPRNQDVARANADGDYDLPTYFGARLVTLGGRVICTSQAAAQHLRSRLTGLVPGHLVRVQVKDEGVTSWADVKLADAVTTKRVGSLVRFQYQLRAPDSRKFGEARTFPLINGTYVDLSHRGNYNATAVVTVTGNAPGGYTIQEPGGVYYHVTGSLSPGQTHTIDFRTGVFRINGYIISGQTGVSDLWFIEPGSTKAMRITSAGTVNATATVIDTFI